MGKTQDSWERMVYGQTYKKRRRRPDDRAPSKTDPVTYVATPFPHKHKYWHRNQPPVYRAERR